MNLAQTTKDAEGVEHEGMPVCIAASHIDGLVLTLTSYSHNYNYRSAVVYGYATTVKDEEEKLYAMELITNSVVPDRWRHTRLPPLPAEMQSTNILKVRISSASAKISAGSATDDKADLSNEALVEGTWTGVLPLYQTMGEPVPSGYNKVGEVPEHVLEFQREINVDRREAALAAAVGERRAL